MFDPLSIGITLGSSILGGILGGSAEAEKERKMRQQIQRAQALAREGLMSKEQLANRLRDIDRLFNKRLISTLNSTAFGGRRLANANVAGASVAGQLGGQAEASKVQFTSEVDNRNAQINQYIAGLEAGAPVFSQVEGIAGGFFGGAQVGMGVSRMLNRPDINMGQQPRANTPSMPDGGQYDVARLGNMNAPRIGSMPKISEEDLYSFNPLKSYRYF